MEYYDRYKAFRKDGFVETPLPYIRIPEYDTDIILSFNPFTMRMDTLSYQYYNDCDYSWLILQANPQYGSLEFKIENNSKLRIPYPLNVVLQGYEEDINKYIKLYGLN